jgi:hypothetical protein
VTAYDLATAAFMRESPRLAVDSNDQNVRTNADGSVDIYFGPVAHAGQGANWIYTAPGKPWISFLRLYGPERAALDKTWFPGDVQVVR